jgi:hypothetical protein
LLLKGAAKAVQESTPPRIRPKQSCFIDMYFTRLYPGEMPGDWSAVAPEWHLPLAWQLDEAS